MTINRIILIILACVGSVAGSSPRSPLRHVISNGECFVVFDPYKKPEQVTAYQVTENGFKKLWQSKGWFGYDDEVFLSYDGKSLVRISRTPYALNNKKVADQSVIFIYFQGKLVKEYKLSDLVSEMDSFRDLSHFGLFGNLWMSEAKIVQADRHDIDVDRKDEKADEEFFRSYNHEIFRLQTLENNELFFNLLDGKLIQKRKLIDEKEKQDTEDAIGDPFEK